MTCLLPTWVSVVAVLLLATSCIYDYYDDEEQEEVTVTSLGFDIRFASTGTGSGYEVGSTYENWINISGGDYRIYFFTNDPLKKGNDTFVAEFWPTDLSALSETGYTWYSMSGPVPYDLLEMTDFKIMVLANWGKSNYPAMTSETTIDDVCAFGTYSYKTGFVLDETNLIPFYGISEYKEYDLTANTVTTLSEPICMVRAMAKVEVVLDNADLMFGSVVLHRYNETGYCAPSGVYTQDDYTDYYNSEWYYNNDEIDLHLYNGENDSDTESRTLDMQFALNEDGKNTWYCYVPEYSNMDGDSFASDYAYIQVNLSGLDEDQEKYRIYFRNYAADGTTTPGADYDIGRNVLYRFTVTLSGQWLNVHVDKWEDSFWNNFTSTINE